MRIQLWSRGQQVMNPESHVSTLALPSDPTVKAVVLEHLHHNNQRHDKAHKKLTDRVLGLVETNQELQRQTNALMNTLQELIKDRGLGAGVSMSSPARQEQTSKPASKPIDVVDSVGNNGGQRGCGCESAEAKQKPVTHNETNQQYRKNRKQRRGQTVKKGRQARDLKRTNSRNQSGVVILQVSSLARNARSS